MKKLASLCLTVLLLLALALPAAADVIWEPRDSFYEAHRGECVYVEYYYEAQTQTLYYREPDGPSEEEAIPAGTVIAVSYLWDGGKWGSTTQWKLSDGIVTGSEDYWVDLAAFRRLYGKSDFANEHRKEFRHESGSVSVEEPVCLWTFPGSGECESTGDMEWELDDIEYSQVYTDENGLKWGAVGYYYGWRDTWVCISDPGNPDLPATAPRYAPEAASQMKTPSDGEAAGREDSVIDDEIDALLDAVFDIESEPSADTAQAPAQRDVIAAEKPQPQLGLLLPVILLVALVVAVTSVLLVVLKKRSGEKKP